MDHRLDERRRPQEAERLRHRAAAGRQRTPRVVRRTDGGVSAMRLRRYRSALRIRFDLLQGAVALQELPRAVRLFQVPLASLRAKRSNPALPEINTTVWIASSLCSSQ